MKQRSVSKMICFFFIILFVTIPNISVIAPEIKLSEHLLVTDEYNLLILVSAQYNNDEEIQNAIALYQKAVFDDIQWHSKQIDLHASQQTFSGIDNLIELEYNIHPFTACLIIGEDILLPVKGSYNDMVKPTIKPWATISNNDVESIISISLLQPMKDLDYQTKKNDILNMLHRFTYQRNMKQTNQVTILEASDINYYSEHSYINLTQKYNGMYIEDPSVHEVNQLIKDNHDLFIVHGHSNPSQTKISSGESLFFHASSVPLVKSSVLCIDGCYVSGWWSNASGHAQPYSSYLFETSNTHVMMLGLLSQSVDDEYQFHQAMNRLLEYEILADVLYNTTIASELILLGDPTFHYAK